MIFHRKDRTSINKTVRFPILLIISKKNQALDHQTLINQTKNTTVLIHEFPDGHMSHIENKEELISVFQEFNKIYK